MRSGEDRPFGSLRQEIYYSQDWVKSWNLQNQLALSNKAIVYGQRLLELLITFIDQMLILHDTNFAVKHLSHHVVLRSKSKKEPMPEDGHVERDRSMSTFCLSIDHLC